MNKLIIVGNGFDLAHNLKTGYTDFSKKYENNINMNKFKTLIKPFIENEEDENKNWYDFEQNFEIISNDNCYNVVGTQNYKMLDSMNEYNDLFNQITKLLFEYLKNEVKLENIKVLEKLKSEFTEDSITFSYNYTDTISLYTDNYKFIHGSINEDEYIILGYAVMGPEDLAAKEHRKFNKSYLQAKLDYIRYLKEKNIVNIDYYLDEYEPQLDCMFSGKGGYCDYGENDIKFASDMLTQYINNEHYSPFYVDLNYKEITELVIMGHGLKSDLLDFDLLSRLLVSLKKIIIYSYEGENEQELKEKIEVLKNIFHVSNIEIKFYE